MYAFGMTILWLKYPYTVMVLGHSESIYTPVRQFSALSPRSRLDTAKLPLGSSVVYRLLAQISFLPRKYCYSTHFLLVVVKNCYPPHLGDFMLHSNLLS